VLLQVEQSSELGRNIRASRCPGGGCCFSRRRQAKMMFTEGLNESASTGSSRVRTPSPRTHTAMVTVIGVPALGQVAAASRSPVLRARPGRAGTGIAGEWDAPLEPARLPLCSSRP
jgi:hypothetical protein